MYNTLSAFTHDEDFESSIGSNHDSNVTFNAATLTDAVVVHDSEPASDNAL